MKKYLLIFATCLVVSVSASVSAAIYYVDFKVVDSNAWYADEVNGARYAGWMKGYDNGNFGPENPVLRAEMAAILSNYDKRVRQMHGELRAMMCHNKNNSLEHLGAQVTDEEKYSEAIESFCSTD